MDERLTHAAFTAHHGDDVAYLVQLLGLDVRKADVDFLEAGQGPGDLDDALLEPILRLRQQRRRGQGDISLIAGYDHVPQQVHLCQAARPPGY
jgi:hypothetical protein